jgi:glycerol uptake operon antiterminator
MPVHDFLARVRIVPAVRDISRLPIALASGAPLVIAFSPSLDTLHTVVRQVKDAGAELIVHADMMEGIASDAVGLRFLAKCGVAGIATTRTQTLALGRQAGLLITFRAFLIDSTALTTVARIVERNHPDIVEALPAPILSHLPGGYISGLGVPVLAGGLVNTMKDVESALSSGAIAVSTSNESLWGQYKSNIQTQIKEDTENGCHFGDEQRSGVFDR